MADLVLVYGDRAKRLANQSGFPTKKVKPIYNSLDYAAAQAILNSIRANELNSIHPQSLFKNSSPIMICTARLTQLCELNLLMEASSLLSRRGRPVNVLLVGDGPERAALEVQASHLGLSVHFFGSCYDEQMLGRLIFHSDIMVQPGKMGLTVIHSLMYGTPAITHSDMNHQMPEAESIIEGRTGLLFRRGDAADLADKIDQWLLSCTDREAVRKECMAVIEEKWNPAVQRRLIEEALEGLLGR
ncbi:hypothetical protein UNPA324_30855 [Bradyrhizobium sp. UNPA324]|nr:hypothetical protein UNPA324_30855 [Bradyrhizobium sp. UNPA324]